MDVNKALEDSRELILIFITTFILTFLFAAIVGSTKYKKDGVVIKRGLSTDAIYQLDLDSVKVIALTVYFEREYSTYDEFTEKLDNRLKRENIGELIYEFEEDSYKLKTDYNTYDFEDVFNITFKEFKTGKDIIFDEEGRVRTALQEKGIDNFTAINILGSAKEGDGVGIGQFTGTDNNSGSSSGPSYERPEDGKTYFNVRFNLSGGTGSFRDQFVEEGGVVSDPGTPQRPGYTFRAWNPPLNTAIRRDTTFVALWDRQGTDTETDRERFEVVFDLNGGIGNITSQRVLLGSRVVKPDDPGRDGYSFAGWQPSIDTIIKGNTVFTAQWDRRAYQITIDKGDGDFEYRTANYGDIIELPQAIGKLQHRLIGWNPDPSKPITGDTTFTPIWEKYLFEVTFDTIGGSPVGKQYVVLGEKVDKEQLEDPEKEGNVFLGWLPDVDETIITEDTRFVAIWDPIIVNVTINYPYREPETRQVNYGQRISLPTHYEGTGEYEGLIFGGWSPDPNQAITSDTVFNPIWKKQNLEVKFDTDGGTPIPDSQFVLQGSRAFVPEEPKKVGHIFEGWEPDIERTVINEATTFKAKWKAEEYTTTFDLKGGTINGSTSDLKYIVEYGQISEIPEDPILDGRQFMGWSPDPEILSITKDTTFVALWGTNSYVVKFHYDDGTGRIKRFQVLEDKEVPDPSISLEKYGYRFTGNWNPPIETKITENTDFYPVWEKNTYKAIYKDETGKIISENDILYDEMSTPPTYTANKTGYTHEGWTPNPNTTSITRDTIFTPVLVPIEIDIEFDFLGQRENITGKVKYNEYAQIPEEIPTRESFTFAGWSPNPVETKIKENTIFKPLWSVRPVNVTFDFGYEEAGTVQQIVEYNGYANPPKIPYREGYLFKYWDEENPETTQIIEETTFTAVWEKEKFKVLYLDKAFDLDRINRIGEEAVTFEQVYEENKSNILYEYSQDFETEVINTPEIVREKGKVIGWDFVHGDNRENVVSNLIFIANWEMNKVNVTFDLNGGYAPHLEDAIQVDYGTVLTEPSPQPVNDENDFIGWAPDITMTTITEDITFTAIWEEQYHRVQFDLNAEGNPVENAPTDKLIRHGNYIGNVSIPTRIDSEFVRWEPNPLTTPILEDTIFTAVWKIKEFNIIFDTAGGLEGTIVRKVKYGEMPIEPGTVTRPGQTFEEWVPNVITPATENKVYTAKYYNDMVIEFQTTANQTITLPLVKGPGELRIKWEEEILTFDDYTDELVYEHTYTTAGRHQVSIIGTVDEVDFAKADSSTRSSVRQILKWGGLGTKKVSFEGASNLEYATPIGRYSFEDLIDASNLFKDNINLEVEIEAFYNNFKYSPMLISTNSMFKNTRKITGSLSSELLNNPTTLQDIRYMFENATGISGSIPEDLFRYQTRITDFTGVFKGMTGLSGTIPSTLFSTVVDLQNVTETFMGATGLSGTPVPLWNVPTVIDYFNCYKDTNVNKAGMPNSDWYDN